MEVTYTHPASAQTAFMYPLPAELRQGLCLFRRVGEQSANASRYNLIENGDFTWSDPEAGSMFGWHAGVGTGARGESSTSAAPQMDTHVLCGCGRPERGRKEQIPELPKAAAGRRLHRGRLGEGRFGAAEGWGAQVRYHRARLPIRTRTTDDQMVSFNPDAEQWQYARSWSWRSRTIPLLQIYHGL